MPILAALTSQAAGKGSQQGDRSVAVAEWDVHIGAQASRAVQARRYAQAACTGGLVCAIGLHVQVHRSQSWGALQGCTGGLHSHAVQ